MLLRFFTGIFIGLVSCSLGYADNLHLAEKDLEKKDLAAKVGSVSRLLKAANGIDLHLLIPDLQERLANTQTANIRIDLLKKLMLYTRYFGNVEQSVAYGLTLRGLAAGDKDILSLIDFLAVIDSEQDFNHRDKIVTKLTQVAKTYDVGNHLRRKIYHDVVRSQASLRSYHSFLEYQALLNHYHNVSLQPEYAFETYMLLWQLSRMTFDLADTLKAAEQLIKHSAEYGYSLNRAVLFYNLSDRTFAARQYDLALVLANNYLEMVEELEIEEEYFFAYFLKSKIQVYSKHYRDAGPVLKKARDYLPQSSYWQSRMAVNQAIYFAKTGKPGQAEALVLEVENIYKENPDISSKTEELMYPKAILSLYKNDVETSTGLFDSYWNVKRSAEMSGQYKKLKSVRSLLQEVVAQERKQHLEAETNLQYFKIASGLLVLAMSAVLLLAFRQLRITRDLIDSKTKLSQANQYLERLNQTDDLTKLSTKLFWETNLSKEYHRLQGNPGLVSSVIILDIDLFKQVNDNYGHVVGDQVIRSIAKVIKNANRQFDISGRIGGEEFAIYLPDTNADSAYRLAERLRIMVEDLDFTHDNHNFKCSISLGVAEFDKAFGSAVDWIDCADSALYQAKRTGRNKTKIFQRKSVVRLVQS